MTRLTGPDEADRVVYRPDGRAAAQGETCRLYADALKSAPADVLTEAGGAIPVSGGAAVIAVDSVSKVPRLQYPASGASVIYCTVNDGPVQALRSDLDVQISTPRATVLSSQVPFTTTKIHGFGSIVMTVLGMNGSGRIWTRDATNGNLSQTDDWGANWSNLRGLPANTSQLNLFKIVPFGGYIYTVLYDTTTTDTYKVYRAPDVVRTAPLVWEAPVFSMPSLTHANVRSCFNAGSQYLFLGTYTSIGNDTTLVYRSSNGTSWSACYGPVSGGHHIHAVAEDPYNAGHIYVTVGDNASTVCVARSTDHGTTWQTIISGTPGNNPWQSVQISFTPKWVWMAADRIGLECAVFNRTNPVPYMPCSNLHYNTAVPGATAATDRFYRIGYWGAADPGTESFYLIANDTSDLGNTQGIFALSHVGGRMELFESAPSGGVGEVFIGNGYVWAGERKWLPMGTSRINI